MVCGIAEALDTENPPVRLHSGAVRCTLSVRRDLKTEMLIVPNYRMILCEYPSVAAFLPFREAVCGEGTERPS
jgi:hypothetical protein